MVSCIWRDRRSDETPAVGSPHSPGCRRQTPAPIAKASWRTIVVLPGSCCNSEKESSALRCVLTLFRRLVGFLFGFRQGRHEMLTDIFFVGNRIVPLARTCDLDDNFRRDG